MGYYAQAQLLGSLMQKLGRGDESVGWLFSVENAALALSTLAAAGPLARWSRARTALAGCLLVAAANVASAFARSYEALVASLRSTATVHIPFMRVRRSADCRR
jgi:predicted MFS family arabinose efflux permease